MPAAPAAKAAAQPVTATPALLAQHSALYDAWLANAASDHYFIQLAARSAEHIDDVENFLARAGQSLEPSELRVYRTGTPDNGKISIIYGDYPTRAAAWAPADRSLNFRAMRASSATFRYPAAEQPWLISR